MNRRTKQRVLIVGVVREVQRYVGPRTVMVVHTDDGRLIRGRLPAALREKALALPGRRVAFIAHVDGDSFYYPMHAGLVTAVELIDITHIGTSRMGRHDAAGRQAVVVDVRTRDQGDAVLVLPLDVSDELVTALTTAVVAPTRKSG